MNPDNITLGLAFVAGFISFISPCVLPLVPAYIGYMGGRVTNTVAAQVAIGSMGNATLRPSSNARFATALHGVSFVAGFTFVFVTIGLLTTAFIREIGGQNVVMTTAIIGRLGGILIIFFGLHVMGILPPIFNNILANKDDLKSPLITLALALTGSVIILWGFTGTVLPELTKSIPTTAGELVVTQWPTIIALVTLTIYWLWLILGGAFTKVETFWSTVIVSIQAGLYTDTRKQITARSGQGYASSAIMGVVFSAGWTPCIGPVYGAVLTLAANTGDVGHAAPLLATYSLGLGVPFILTALLLDSAQGLLRKLQRYMHTIEVVSGAFLILIGFLVATGTLQNLSQTLAIGEFADAATNLEESVIGSLTGQDTAAAVNPTAIPSTPAASTGLGSITGAAAAMNSPISGTNIGNVAPDFETVTETGKTTRLSDFRGQVVLLNFWGTWCGPCRVEMPAFESAYDSKKSTRFTILAVNNRDTTDAVSAFRKEFGLSFPLVMDDSAAISKTYGVVSFPSTYVLNQQGVITARHFGALTTEQIQELVTQALT
ncbi:MAG: cytochrome c biogenesis protein CcdA [Chloroflexota bacterium]